MPPKGWRKRDAIKRVAKKPLPKKEPVLVMPDADFPCEESRAFAEEMLEVHGEKFVVWLKARNAGAIPISLLKHWAKKGF